MLVLSRKQGQKIEFPGLNASIQVVEFRPGVVRLGIDAPDNVVCVREEVPVDPAEVGKFLKAAELAHKLGGKLNSTSVGLGLLKKQFQAKRPADEILATIERMIRGLDIEQEEAPAPAKRKLHTLLVEDDDNQRELLGGLLRMNGWDVELAASGSEAMERLGMPTKPDVVLLDVGLGSGKMNGCEVAATIRENHDLDQMKIVMVTGEAVPARVPRVDRWLRKPVQPERLVREIAHLCAGTAA